MTFRERMDRAKDKRFNRIPPEERFWPKVDKDGLDGCWLWTARTLEGYGLFAATPTLTVRAHRWSYEQFVGPIPEGLVIDHLCRNPSCVNPDHLEPVTRLENARRGLKGALRTHCKYGHPLDDANTYHARGNRRVCRTCQNDVKRRRYHELKAQGANR